MKIQNKQPNNFSYSAPQKNTYNLEEEKQRINKGIEKMKLELIEEWKRAYANAEVFPPAIAKISPQIRDALLSFENTLLYNSLAEKLKLSKEQRDTLPKIVWQSCLQDKTKEITSLIQSGLNTSPETTKQISDSINQKILSRITSPQTNLNKIKNPISQVEKIEPIQMKLQEALKKISGFGDQLITSEIIQIKNSSEKSRPSIKNWLADYYFNLGNEQHNSIQRGGYLFQSPNGKKLSSSDRQKLNYILKADDEELSININPESKKIIFPKFKEAQSRKVISHKETAPKREMEASSQSQKLAKPAFSFSKKETSVNPKPIAPKKENKENIEKIIKSNQQFNIQNATFSSPQKMMSEKKSETPKKIQPATPPKSESQKPKEEKSFSEELKNLKKDQNTSKKDGDKIVNVVNLKDLV